MPQIKYSWDVVNDTVSEEVSDGNLGVQYDMRPERFGESLSQFRSGSTSYYFYDAQGSTRNLTDELGNVSDEYTFAAFGEEISATGSTLNSFRYGGASGYLSFPNSSVQYIRARNYSVVDNRWLSIDPVQFVDGPNNYLYLNNQPINFRDPSGKLRYTAPKTFTDGCEDTVGVFFNWELDKNYEEAGYIVQKIEIRCALIDCPKLPDDSGECDCDKCPPDPPKEPNVKYYEAWYVEPGKNSPPNREHSGKDDHWYLKPQDEKCAGVIQYGEARFYLISQTGDIGRTGRANEESSWKINESYGDAPCGYDTGDIPSHKDDPTPDFWKNKRPKEVIKHQAEIAYRCCDGCKDIAKVNHKEL